MSQEPPSPLRIVVHVPWSVLCSHPGCAEKVDLDRAPLVFVSGSDVPVLDRREVQGHLATLGWKMGVIRFRPGVIVAPGSEPMVDAIFPVALCPLHHG